MPQNAATRRRPDRPERLFGRIGDGALGDANQSGRAWSPPRTKPRRERRRRRECRSLRAHADQPGRRVSGRPRRPRRSEPTGSRSAPRGTHVHSRTARSRRATRCRGLARAGGAGSRRPGRSLGPPVRRSPARAAATPSLFCKCGTSGIDCSSLELLVVRRAVLGAVAAAHEGDTHALSPQRAGDPFHHRRLAGAAECQVANAHDRRVDPMHQLRARVIPAVPPPDPGARYGPSKSASVARVSDAPTPPAAAAHQVVEMGRQHRGAGSCGVWTRRRALARVIRPRGLFRQAPWRVHGGRRNTLWRILMRARPVSPTT